MFSDFHLTDQHRLWILTLSISVLGRVKFTTLKNSVWMYFTGKWFEGKPIRYWGTVASLGVLEGLWNWSPPWAVALAVLGFATTDGAVLLAEARQRRSGLSRQ